MKKILITDSLFIYDKHVKALESAGYEVVRLDKPDASEKELIEAVSGVEGYILGGIEYVTAPVISAANSLKAIVFTGTGYKGHIPAWQTAFNKGILIGNTPYANVHEVAEWGIAATLAMQRDLFSLGSGGKKKFSTVNSLTEITVGIVGLGHIGKKYAEMIESLGAKKIVYWSREEKDVNYEYLELDMLLQTSDIIFIAVSDDAGQNFVNSEKLQLMKKDSLLVSIAHHGIINEQDLAQCLTGEKIRAAVDIVRDHDKFAELPKDRWYGSNASAAYNVWSFLYRASDMAVTTLLNLLEKGTDQNQIKSEDKLN